MCFKYMLLTQEEIMDFHIIKVFHASKIEIYVTNTSNHSISSVPNRGQVKGIQLLLNAESCAGKAKKSIMLSFIK